MPTIREILTDAASGALTEAACVQLLKESEGSYGGSKQPGHPLQHIAEDDSSTYLRSLEDSYHLRGPAKLVAGNIVDTPGNKPKAHSQFWNTAQAATYLKAVLESKAGINALGILNSTAWLVSIKYGIGSDRASNFAERSLQVMSATNPNHNFVMLLDRSIRSIVVVLHRADHDRLHVQTLYPTNKSFPPGAGQVTFKSPGNPDPPGYSVLP
jgi:hypothetical protein